MTHSKIGLGLGLGLCGNKGRARPAPLYAQSSPSSNNFTGNSASNACTIFFKFAYTSAPASNQTLGMARVDGSNYIWLQSLSNGNFTIVINSAGSASTYVIAPDYIRTSGKTTITVSAKEDQVYILVNGITVYKISAQAMPVGSFTQFGVGELHSGTQDFSGSIDEYRFYKMALSEVQCRNIGRLKGFSDFGLSGSYCPNRLIHFKLGQSNSVGTQATAPGSEATYYDNYSCMQIIRKDGVLDDTYQDPSCAAGTGAMFSNFNASGQFSSGGVEIDVIAEANPGKDVAIMHIDRGNTGLVNDTGNFRWYPYNTGTANVHQLNVPAYQSIYMQMAGELYGVPFSRTWWQGENDAGDASVTPANYEARLIELLELWNAYLRVPTIVVGLHNEPSGGRINWADIQGIQADINSSVPNAYAVSAAGASTVADQIHLDASGYASVGALIGAQINAVT